MYFFFFFLVLTSLWSLRLSRTRDHEYVIQINWTLTLKQHLRIPLREMKLPPVLLFRVYPPKGKVSKNLRLFECASINAYISLSEQVGSAGFEPAIFCLKWGRCQGYPNSTQKTGPDGIPLHHPTQILCLKGCVKVSALCCVNDE